MKIDMRAVEEILPGFIELPFQAVEPALYARVTEYKRRVASTFKSIGKSFIPRISGNAFFISLELDGEHAQLYYENGEAMLIRPRGFVYLGLPCIADAVEVLSAAGIQRALFPGELYATHPEGKRTRVHDVVRLTKKPRGPEDLARLRFAPFDIQLIDDEEVLDFSRVFDRLHGLFSGTPLAPPAWVRSDDRSEIMRCYREWVEEGGAEGLMIRTDLTYRYKLKAEHTVDAVIIGYVAEDQMVTCVLVALVDEDGNLQVLDTVEKGFTDVQRADLYQRFQEIPAESTYTEVSRFHTPFLMVKPTIIIECSANDMTAERRNGKPVKKAVLSLKKGVYRLVRSAHFVSLQHTVFQRFREDKAVNAHDLRKAQVTDFIFIDLDERRGREIAFPEVEIILREVYVKETKGKVAVRKLVAWKTNKETLDEAYTAYTLVLIDYSAGRKDPLKQDVRVSDSREQILILADRLRQKNVKKGWVREDTER